MLNFSEIGSRRNRTENLWNKVLKFEKNVENDLKLMKMKKSIERTFTLFLKRSKRTLTTTMMNNLKES